MINKTMTVIFLLVSVLAQEINELKDAISNKNCVIIGEIHTETCARVKIEENFLFMKKEEVVLCIELPKKASEKAISVLDFSSGHEPEEIGSLTHLLKKAKKIKIPVCFIDTHGDMRQRNKHMAGEIKKIIKEGRKVVSLVGAAHANRAEKSLTNMLGSEKTETIFFHKKSSEYELLWKDGSCELWGEAIIFNKKQKKLIVKRRKMMALNYNKIVTID